MNLQETVASLFPQGVITDCGRDNGCSLEVHGLPRNAVPCNCAVLASGQFQFSSAQERRESYLVKIEDFVLFVRLSPESPDSHFAEIAMRTGPGRPAQSATH
jgi:hypothetical protein